MVEKWEKLLPKEFTNRLWNYCDRSAALSAVLECRTREDNFHSKHLCSVLSLSYRKKKGYYQKPGKHPLISEALILEGWNSFCTLWHSVLFLLVGEKHSSLILLYCLVGSSALLRPHQQKMLRAVSPLPPPAWILQCNSTFLNKSLTCKHIPLLEEKHRRQILHWGEPMELLNYNKDATKSVLPPQEKIEFSFPL